MKLAKAKVHLIYNPIAGPWDVQNGLKRACSALGKQGWSVELRQTEKPGDATTMAREAAQADCDVLIVAGGDGTVNEAVNGLIGTQTALSVLPVGTGNLWARQLRIPSYMVVNPLLLRETAIALTHGVVRTIDVGKANERYFLCWAGVGLDAQVVTEIEPRPRHTKHLGMVPYIIATMLVARDFKGVRTRVQLDGSIVRGRTLLIVVNNIQQYAGKLHIINQARIDDGLLDVFIFRGLGFSYALRHTFTMISRRCMQDPQIVNRQARCIKIHTEHPIPVQADGDPIDTTPVVLRAVPGALRVLIPPSAPADLFTPPPPRHSPPLY